MMDIVYRCRAAGRDERLSTGALYLEAVIEIERLRAELVAMKFAFDTAKKGQPDPDAAVRDECERLRAERDALLELLRCVSTNLKKNMSKSMQELQARTIDAAMREKP